MTLAIQKLIRVSEQWGLPLLLAKLDVRMAFESLKKKSGPLLPGGASRQRHGR